MALSSYPPPDGRRRVKLFALALGLLMLLALAPLAWLFGTARGQAVWEQANSRSPNELIRYTERRLQGHPRLERWLLPPLHALRARVEPEPPPGPLPDLGKGQRPEALPPPAGLSSRLVADTPQAIRDALLNATPGTQIVVAPGLYPFDATLRLGHDGRTDAPIALRAERPGTVWFSFTQVDGIRVDRPHWVFENLDIRGTCARHGDCEHAFHVIGRGAQVGIRNNRITDFNAHVKVNGQHGHWPDGGELAWNTLSNTGPRDTAQPVVMLDLVGAHRWRVHDNRVTNFVKRHGNRVAYGLFAKGASEGIRIERNLLVCTPGGISQPGERIGISVGGGGTDPEVCRDRTCQAHEHRDGLAANNVIAHCNDAGVDVNRGVDVRVAHNTLINTAGITVRAGSRAELDGNLVEGRVWRRDGSRVDQRGTTPLGQWLDPAAAAALQWQWQQAPNPGPLAAGLSTDFNGQSRAGHYAPGALLP
jgi:hypothetical protein